MIDLFVAASLVALGLLVGTVSAMVGVGGGVFVVPALILVYGLQSQQAVGTSLGMTVFTAIFGSIAYMRQGRIDWRVGLLAAGISIPAASLGAYSSKFLSSSLLGAILGGLIAALALRMVLSSLGPGDKVRGAFRITQPRASRGNLTRPWSRTLVDSSGTTFRYDVHFLRGIAPIFAGGYAAGLLGVGGGILIVPVYSEIMGMPIHVAVATTLLSMIFTSISGVTVHLNLGNIFVDYVAALALGIFFGSQLGASFARRLHRRTLMRYFGLAAFVVAFSLVATMLFG